MIIVRRTYLPKPGTGGEMLKLVRQAAEEMAKAGFPRPQVARGWHGSHGTVFTDQQWKSIADYEASRDAVRRTKAITSVFEHIYPQLAQTHDTQILEVVE